MRDYVSLEKILYGDEEDWNKEDALYYNAIEYKRYQSFYANINDTGRAFIIQNILMELTPQERLFIEMIFYEKLSYRQCAKILNLPRSTIHLFVNKILRKMKKMVEEKYYVNKNSKGEK